MTMSAPRVTTAFRFRKALKMMHYLNVPNAKRKNYKHGGMNCPVDGEAIRGKTKIRIKGI